MHVYTPVLTQISWTQKRFFKGEYMLYNIIISTIYLFSRATVTKWVPSTTENLFSHSSGSWEVQDQGTADSRESSLPGLQTATFLLYLHRRGWGRGGTSFLVSLLISTLILWIKAPFLWPRLTSVTSIKEAASSSPDSCCSRCTYPGANTDLTGLLCSHVRHSGNL